MGRAAIRAIASHPQLRLCGVIVSSEDKAGRDAGELVGGAPLGVLATLDAAEGLRDAHAVAYMASGELRPDDALADIERCLRHGATVVTPSIYALYDPESAPPEMVASVVAACDAGGAALFVSGIDPGWGNDLLPVLASGLCGAVDTIRAQEIFDYSTYDQPDTVRYLVGMGQPMNETPPMVAPTIPTMVWGSSIRLIARALGAEVSEIREVVERRPLESDVTNRLGEFAAGTQGALRFEVQGIVDGEPRIVIEHVTRIDPGCAPDWPQPATGAGSHLVLIEGSPNLTITVEAEEEGGNRAAGGNATAASRLIGAIPWLRAAEPGIYDALDVPLTPGHLRSHDRQRGA